MDFRATSMASNGHGSELDSRISAFRNGSSSIRSSCSMSSRYSFDVQKFLKDVLKRREDVPAARVMPKTHLLAQLVLQEQAERELFGIQERSFRQQILHKRDEERWKIEEQRVQQRNREKLEELKKKQAEEFALKKELAVSFHKQIDAEVKERLRIVCLLQPRMGIAATVLADVKNELSLCRLLPELMEEDKRVSKALKADSRHNKGPNDSGAVPHWVRTCVAGSFNVAAIMQDSPLRATVEDAIKVPNAALRKLVVVRNTENNDVVVWVHVRAGSDPVAVATELAQLPAPEELPRNKSAGVVWTKEDLSDLNRKAKTAPASEADLMPVVGVSSASLSCEGITTFEFAKKDIENIGQVASM